MKSLLVLAFLIMFINASANTYFTNENGEEDDDCVNEVIEYAVDTTDDIAYLWGAVCEEDEVTDDCIFWAFKFVLTSDVVSEVWAGESSDNTDSVATAANAGTDDYDAGNCVESEDSASTAICTYEVDSSEGSGYGYYFYVEAEPIILRRNLVDSSTERGDITAEEWGTGEECAESDSSVEMITF